MVYGEQSVGYGRKLRRGGQDIAEKRPGTTGPLAPAALLALPDLAALSRPSTCPHLSGIPLPSCWGARGSPWSLRCLTIGGPAKPPALAHPPECDQRRRPGASACRSWRRPAATFQRSNARKKRKGRGPPTLMSRDASMMSMTSAVSVRSIVDSESWHLPGYLGTQDKEQLGELCRVLREELAACDTQKAVDHVSRMAAKIVCEGGAAHFNISGRLAYRLREASRSVGSGSSFAPLECRHQLAFRKVLRCEVRRRAAEIAGWGEKAAEELALATDIMPKEAQHRTLADPPSYRKPNFLEPLPAKSYRQPTGKTSNADPFGCPYGSLDEWELEEETAFQEEILGEAEVDKADQAIEEPCRVAVARSGSTVSRTSTRAVSRNLSALSRASQAGPSEAKILKVYNALREDIGLHHDEVTRALLLLGFKKPESSWISEVLSGITKYVNLSSSEWIKFVAGYAERQHLAVVEAFAACDEDDSGVVEVPELIKLMRQFQIEPMKHVLAEVVAEVDVDGSNTLNLEEFEVVMGVLRGREGFTRSEYEDFVALFHRYDNDKSGEIDANELCSIINWLGFACDAERVDQILKEVDFDGSGMLNESEFLTCMRRMRESELDVIREAIERNDSSGDGFVRAESLRTLFDGLGYDADMDAIMEAASDAGTLSQLTSQGLSLDELWKLLVVYRSREGFSSHDNTDIQQAFQRFLKSASSEMSVLEVGKVLRWLGYTPSLEAQQSLVAKVDVDSSGKLNATEFRKLVRMLQAKEIEISREAFRKRDRHDAGHLSKEMAIIALRAAGCVDSKGRTPVILPEDTAEIRGRQHVTLESFIRIANRFHKAARRAFRDNSGFSQEEIDEMRKKFDRYDADRSGEISAEEERRLIEELLPTLARQPDMRPKLMQLMTEVDADGSGTINFEDFVRLMQEIQEMKVQERLGKEQIASAKTHFSVKEVEEFRELFMAGDEGDGAGDGFLTFSSLKSMLGAICPLGDKNLAELTRIVEGISSRGRDLSALMLGVDFPDFLLLMRQLLDADFAGLQSRLASDAHTI